MDRAIRNALNVWADVTPLTFKKLYRGNADIMISFGSKGATSVHPDPIAQPLKIVFSYTAAAWLYSKYTMQVHILLRVFLTCLSFTLQSTETTTLLTGLMDCWLTPTPPAKALEETLTLTRTNTGAKIHQVPVMLKRSTEYNELHPNDSSEQCFD